MLKLKILRKKCGLNQTGLAMKLNMSQSTISTYEKGDRMPDCETLIYMADFFDVSVDYLVGLSDLKKQIVQSDLSPDELDILYIYGKLSSLEKERVQAYIDGMLSKSKSIIF